MSAFSDPKSAGASDTFAEVQGLYGPFTFPELLLQKIWWRRNYDTAAARTIDGRTVEIIHPGRWNRLGGPDFRGARLRIGGEPLEGDVEIHLRDRDWETHGHRQDPAYADVKLHVVLFPGQTAFTTGADGRQIPVLALLPLLFHGLEEYAAEDATEALANRPLDQALDSLAALGDEALARVLYQHASSRWELKVHFARTRVERLGWTEACHQTALEILGYRFNRAPMLGVAARWPLAAWRADSNAVAHEAFDVFSEQWKMQGVRPLNHPRTRLAQYADWVSRQPAWPDRLTDIGAILRQLTAHQDPLEETTVTVRKRLGFPALRERVAADICGGKVGGARLDNLICDGFLPLLAASDRSIGGSLNGIWRHWYGGDLPAGMVRGLRALGVFAGARKPIAHGPLQGLVGWMLSQRD